eukprot:NODE_2498_length_916_cov_66.259516_g2053_i0.p1 GENE.NODE_2498_length_916_cov_66.259516_g2053_i0~~NODE_2498_length_916_cov_66.259516_g2053_i0.p1  ORF type:complete len:297 (+),score=54.72 NODE_2498_length_916_cov_66.259516_g2053_i0:118-891(+)
MINCGYSVEEDSEQVLMVQYEAGEKAEVFLFSYGVVVWWGPSEEWGRRALLADLKRFEIGPEDKIEIETCDYSYAEKRGDAVDQSTIQGDHFVLGNHSRDLKLAFSHALAQSAKLTTIEDQIDRVIEDTRPFPEYLSDKSKVHLTRNSIARLRGSSHINLHSSILDTPDFLWHTKLEPVYHSCRRYMNVNRRVNILNRRLGIINELYSVLSDELSHTHDSRLEWIIILLIVVEVVQLIYPFIPDVSTLALSHLSKPY